MERLFVKCSVIGCGNEATHTWSGHPTCDECATPSRSRVKRQIVGARHCGKTQQQKIIADAILEAFYACRTLPEGTVSERAILEYTEKMRGEE